MRQKSFEPGLGHAASSYLESMAAIVVVMPSTTTLAATMTE
jgi:hypothetical protein